MNGKATDKRIWKTILKVLFSAAALYFLFRKCDWAQLAAALKDAKLLYVLFALLSVEVTHGIAAARWQLLCRKSRYFPLLKLVFVSRLYSTVLPGQLFGEAAKVVYISASQPEISPEEATAGVVVDKVAGMIGLLLVGIGGAVFGIGAGSWGILAWFAVFACLLALCVALPAFAPFARLAERFLAAAERRFPKLTGAATRLRLFMASWRTYLKTPLTLALSVLLGCAFQLLSTASLMLLGRAVGVSVPLADWCWIFGVLAIALLLPVSLAGIGVREATLVGFLGAFGVSRELALSASLLLLALQILDSLIGGTIALFDPAMKQKNVRPPAVSGPPDERRV